MLGTRWAQSTIAVRFYRSGTRRLLAASVSRVKRATGTTLHRDILPAFWLPKEHGTSERVRPASGRHILRSKRVRRRAYSKRVARWVKHGIDPRTVYDPCCFFCCDLRCFAGLPFLGVRARRANTNSQVPDMLGTAVSTYHAPFCWRRWNTAAQTPCRNVQTRRAAGGIGTCWVRDMRTRVAVGSWLPPEPAGSSRITAKRTPRTLSRANQDHLDVTIVSRTWIPLLPHTCRAPWVYVSQVPANSERCAFTHSTTESKRDKPMANRKTERTSC